MSIVHLWNLILDSSYWTLVWLLLLLVLYRAKAVYLISSSTWWVEGAEESKKQNKKGDRGREAGVCQYFKMIFFPSFWIFCLIYLWFLNFSPLHGHKKSKMKLNIAIDLESREKRNNEKTRVEERTTTDGVSSIHLKNWNILSR